MGQTVYIFAVFGTIMGFFIEVELGTEYNKYHRYIDAPEIQYSQGSHAVGYSSGYSEVMNPSEVSEDVYPPVSNKYPSPEGVYSLSEMEKYKSPSNEYNPTVDEYLPSVKEITPEKDYIMKPESAYISPANEYLPSEADYPPQIEAHSSPDLKYFSFEEEYPVPDLKYIPTEIKYTDTPEEYKTETKDSPPAEYSSLNSEYSGSRTEHPSANANFSSTRPNYSDPEQEYHVKTQAETLSSKDENINSNSKYSKDDYSTVSKISSQPEAIYSPAASVHSSSEAIYFSPETMYTSSGIVYSTTEAVVYSSHGSVSSHHEIEYSLPDTKHYPNESVPSRTEAVYSPHETVPFQPEAVYNFNETKFLPETIHTTPIMAYSTYEAVYSQNESEHSTASAVFYQTEAAYPTHEEKYSPEITHTTPAAAYATQEAVYSQHESVQSSPTTVHYQNEVIYSSTKALYSSETMHATPATVYSSHEVVHSTHETKYSPETMLASPATVYSAHETKYSPETVHATSTTVYSIPEAEYSQHEHVHSPSQTVHYQTEAIYATHEGKYSPETTHTTPATVYSIPEAEYSKPKAEYSIPEAEYSIPKAEYSIPEAEYSIPEAEYSIPEAEYSKPKAEYSQHEHVHSSPQTTYHQTETVYYPIEEKYSPETIHTTSATVYPTHEAVYLTQEGKYSPEIIHTTPTTIYSTPEAVYFQHESAHSSPQTVNYQTEAKYSSETMHTTLVTIYSTQDEMYSPETIHSTPATMYSKHEAVYSTLQAEYSQHEPQAVHYQPEAVYSQPHAVYSLADTTYSATLRNYSPTEAPYSSTPTIYSSPEAVYSTTEKYSSPQVVYSTKTAKYSPDLLDLKSPPENAEYPDTNEKYPSSVVEYSAEVKQSTPGAEYSSSQSKYDAPVLTPAPVSKEKLDEILKLSPFDDKGKPEGYTHRSEVCYTTECADSALHILQSINYTVDPCDDFYSFACGRWIADYPVPPKEYSISVIDIQKQQSEDLTKKILTSAENYKDLIPINQAKQFYALCTDAAAREKAGIGPILGKVRTYGGWPTITTDWEPTGFNLIKAIDDSNRFLQNVVNGQRVFSDSAILAIYVKEDMKDAQKQIIYLDQPGFLLSRSILLHQARFESRINAYKTLYFNLASALISFQDYSISPESIRAEAEKVLEFETELARISASGHERRDFRRIYNPRQLESYQEEIDAINPPVKHSHCKIKWLTLLKKLASGSGVTISEEEDLIVLEPSYISKFILLCDVTDVRILANYINFRLAIAYARQTNKVMNGFLSEFDQVVHGSGGKESLEKSCTTTTLNVFGLALGVNYIEEVMYEKQVKPMVETMFEDIKSVFVECIHSIDWMDNSTKSEAIHKAEIMTGNIAYPSFLFNYTRIELEFKKLEIYKKEYFQSWISALTWLVIRDFKTLRRPTDKEKKSWFTYPGNVQLFYMDQLNSLVIPAMLPPFYRLNAPEYINHGGIGIKIATSMIRGFYDLGSEYDSQGTARNWWTNTTTYNYSEKVKCLIEQVSSYVTPVGNVNGEMTLSSNVGDNAGVHLAYKAYKKLLKQQYDNEGEKRLPGLEKYTPEQLFFLQYATTMCQSITLDGTRNQIVTGIRPPNQYRVISALQNFDIFAEIWDCPSGSYMNPPPDKECIIY